MALSTIAGFLYIQAVWKGLIIKPRLLNLKLMGFMI
jgi:hypothetical protein